MIRSHPSHRLARPFALCILLVATHVTSSDNSKVRIEQLLRGPNDDYQTELRVTSRWHDGRKSVVQLKIQRRRLPHGDRFDYRMIGDRETRAWCTICTAGGNSKAVQVIRHRRQHA